MLAATMLAATYSIRPERPSSTPESSPGTEPILPGRNPLTPDEWIVDVIYHELQDNCPPQANWAVGTGKLLWSRRRLDAVSIPPLGEESDR